VRNLQREQVRTAIQQLPIEFREIIILREYEELSYSEIAKVLQCPMGTVMSRLARARSRLGDLLSISRETLPTENERTVDQIEKRSGISLRDALTFQESTTITSDLKGRK
jgi:RNA polymerase sigma-70 factor (ECF subfamily)